MDHAIQGPVDRLTAQANKGLSLACHSPCPGIDITFSSRSTPCSDDEQSEINDQRRFFRLDRDTTPQWWRLQAAYDFDDGLYSEDEDEFSIYAFYPDIKPLKS